jgi:hypothetical protein
VRNYATKLSCICIIDVMTRDVVFNNNRSIIIIIGCKYWIDVLNVICSMVYILKIHLLVFLT